MTDPETVNGRARRVVEIRDRVGNVIGRNEEPIDEDAGRAEVDSWLARRNRVAMFGKFRTFALELRDATEPTAWADLTAAKRWELVRRALRVLALLALDRSGTIDPTLLDDEGTTGE